MRLDRNSKPEGPGKYAIVKLREMPADGIKRDRAENALAVLLGLGMLEYSTQGGVGEFFVMRLRDQYAGGALSTYASLAAVDDKEYAADIFELAGRAGRYHPACKRPD